MSTFKPVHLLEGGAEEIQTEDLEFGFSSSVPGFIPFETSYSSVASDRQEDGRSAGFQRFRTLTISAAFRATGK